MKNEQAKTVIKEYKNDGYKIFVAVMDNDGNFCSLWAFTTTAELARFALRCVKEVSSVTAEEAVTLAEKAKFCLPQSVAKCRDKLPCLANSL